MFLRLSSPITPHPRARTRPSCVRVLWTIGTAVLALALTACDPLDTVLTSMSDTPAPDAELVQVERVIDGDTADVRLDTGEQIRVRVLGIDTPETVKPDAPPQCWGIEASDWAHGVLDGAWVTTVTDDAAGDTDRYGRALRYLMLANGTNYSVLAAQTGMARSYVYDRQHLSYTPDIAAAENHARAAGLGVWGAPCHGQTETP